MRLIEKLGLLFLAIILTISLARSISRASVAQKKITDTKQRLEHLRLQNQELEFKVEEVRSESFIEKTARDKLGLAKKGELVVVLPDSETIKKFAPKIENDEEFLPDPVWKKWVKLFI